MTMIKIQNKILTENRTFFLNIIYDPHVAKFKQNKDQNVRRRENVAYQ